MARLSERLKKVEKGFFVQQQSPTICVLHWTIDFVEEGYFGDKEEEDAFIEWRVNKFREDNKDSTAPHLMYFMSEDDIEKYYQSFKESSQACERLPANK